MYSDVWKKIIARNICVNCLNAVSVKISVIDSLQSLTKTWKHTHELLQTREDVIEFDDNTSYSYEVSIQTLTWLKIIFKPKSQEQ